LRILPLLAALCFSAAAAGADTSPPATAAIDMSERDGVLFSDYLSARHAAGDRDMAEAAKYFIACLERDPSDPQILTLAFFYATGAGMIDEAAVLAGRLTADVPDEGLSRLVLTAAAMKRGDYKGARVQIAKASQGPLSSFTMTLIDAWAAAGLRDEAAVAADLKRLHTLHGADALVYFNEAMMAELSGRKDAAAAAYLQAFAAPGGSTPRLADAYGRFLERGGRRDEARAHYEKLSDGDVFGTVTVPALARIAKGTIPPPLAASASDGAAEALYGVAAALNDDANRDVSIIYLRLALYLQPRLDRAAMLLANRFEAVGKYEDSIAIYRSIAQDSPLYDLAALGSAIALMNLERSDEAIATLKPLAAQNPAGVEIWSTLGNAYRQKKNFPEAIKAYDRAVQSAGPLRKKDWPLLFDRAGAQQETGNWAAAEADLKQALVLSPSEPQLLNFLGYSWVDKKRNVKEALSMLEKARALSPQDGFIIDSVGWAYYRVGRYDDAAKTLEDAVHLIPSDPTINDHLGDAYWRVGRKREARFQWRHALAFGPEAAEKVKIEKKLQAGLSRNDKS